jgi:hypothetical protein
MSVTVTTAQPNTRISEVQGLGGLEIPEFDPDIHLAYQPPVQRHTFQDLGLPQPQNSPDLCYTEPFQLFSEEGVRILRREMLSREMLDKYLRSWDRAPAYMAGHEKVGDLVFSLKKILD